VKNAVISVLVVVAVASTVGGVWAWETFGPGRVCDQEHATVLEYGPEGRSYPTVEEALTRFGRFPGIRDELPAESLTPTEGDAPEFGATLKPSPDDNDTGGARTYDLWKNGEVVQSVTLDAHRDGWAIGGYWGCSPIP
jgi:hypothetical protein